MKGKPRTLQDFELQNQSSYDVREMSQAYHQRQARKQLHTLDTLERQHQSHIIHSLSKQQPPQHPKLFHSCFSLNKLLDLKATPQDVTFHSLFQDDPTTLCRNFNNPTSLQQVFITTFGFEMDVFQGLAKTGIPITIMNESEGPDVVKNCHGWSNMIVLRPRMAKTGYSVFHSKLWLLRFKGFLRVVIGTGNNHVGDWAVWMNAFWYKDFLQTAQSSDQPIDLDFKQTLQHVYENMFKKEEHRHMININLQEYDYTGLDVYIIPSMPMSYVRPEQYGLAKIRALVESHVKKDNNFSITYQTTSLGILNSQLLQSISSAFTLHKDTTIQVLYPSPQYLSTCKYPPDTLFLRSDNYNKPGFNKTVMTPFQSLKEENFIPHLKMVIATEVAGKAQDESVIYMGSHNLTKAGWGEQKKGQNSQLGILYSLCKDSKVTKQEVLNRLPFNLNPKKEQSYMPYMMK